MSSPSTSATNTNLTPLGSRNEGALGSGSDGKSDKSSKSGKSGTSPAAPNNNKPARAQHGTVKRQTTGAGASIKNRNRDQAARASERSRDRTHSKNRPAFEPGHECALTDDEDDEGEVQVVKVIQPEVLIETQDWTTGRDAMVALLQQNNERITKLEKLLIRQETKSGAAIEMGSDSMLKAKQARYVANSAMRQSSKMCLVMEGKAMPKRTAELEKDVLKTANTILNKHLGFGVVGDEVVSVHYRQPKENNAIIIRFHESKPGSPMDMLIKACREKKPKGLFVKILEAECDEETYYLLRTMRRAGEVSTVYTARSGKPATVKKLDKGKVEFKTFNDVDEVRAIMGAKAKAQEKKQDAEKLQDRRAFAQQEVEVKQAMKDVYVKAEKIKLQLKNANVKSGKGKILQPVERADFELMKNDALKLIGKTKANRQRGIIVDDSLKATTPPLQQSFNMDKETMLQTSPGQSGTSTGPASSQRQPMTMEQIEKTSEPAGTVSTFNNEGVAVTESVFT